MRSVLCQRGLGKHISSVGGIAVVTCMIGLLAVNAQNPTIQIVRVEEDWELHIGTSHPGTAAPQVTCSISPFSHLNGVHAAFDLNHQSQPNFSAGGMQLQIWDGEYALEDTRFRDFELLSTDDETIKWTQVMELNGGTLRFRIEDGESTTWGEFDHSDNLQLLVPTDLENLNSYHPDISVANSGVGYASNRVHCLILKRVRCYTSTGDVYVDSTERVGHTLD